MVYCMSFDPGQTTGVCIVKNESQPWEVVTEQIGPEAHHRYLLMHLALHKPKVIVVETYENRGNDAVDNLAAEYIGVIRAWAQSRCELVPQNSSVRGPSAFWNDAKLKKYGMWVQGKHARDAVKHYLYYRTFTCNDKSIIHQHRAHEHD